MTPAEYETYEQAKERLDQIVADVKDKEISLEASLDLLDEGVELANRCTELIDVASWSKSDEDEGGKEAGDVDAQRDIPVAPESESQVAVDEQAPVATDEQAQTADDEQV